MYVTTIHISNRQFVSFLKLLFDSVFIFTAMLRQKRVILVLVADHRTLQHMFDIATSLMWKLFTLSLQVYTLFKQLLNVCERILVEILVFERGVGHFEHKFPGEWESPTNDSWRQKTRVSELSHGVVCMILRLAVLMQYRHVTDTHTDRHMMTANTHASLALHG